MKPLLSKIFAVLLLCTSACMPTANSVSELTTITLQLGSTHQAIYSGFYAADLNGYYAREGLKVNFIEGGATINLVEPLQNNTAQFAVIGASTLITERADGKPIRALATILRRDPVVFFSLAESGITHLEDFIGKKVLVSQRLRPRLHAMLARVGIRPSQIIEVDTGSFTALYTGEIDVASGLITSSVLSAQRDGYAVNIIYPDDYGVHFYSSTISALDEFILADPDLTARFMRASMDGWAYAIENPQTTGEMVTQYNTNANSEFETASMIAALPYIDTGEDFIGWMQPKVWQDMVVSMNNQGELSVSVNSDDVFTLQYIEQIYKGTQQ